jgi:hypothetical protein
MLAARFARGFTSEYMSIGPALMPVYDTAARALVIPPLLYPSPLPPGLLRVFGEFLRLSDEDLLWETSTSPKHEAPAFATGRSLWYDM